MTETSKDIQEDENPDLAGESLLSPHSAPERCASCGQPPTLIGKQARCSTENCFLQGLMGWMSLKLWNSTMDELAGAQVQQSASDMRHE